MIYVCTVPFVKMEALVPCPSGTEITTESRCREAYSWADSMGLDPGRPLVVGTWNGVPYQCSAQVGLYCHTMTIGDDSLTFNSNSGTDNSRFTTGEFVMICERRPGIQTIAIKQVQKLITKIVFLFRHLIMLLFKHL